MERYGQLQRGFSLIELCVVIAIAGIFMGIAMPSFSQWMANERLKSSAAALEFSLMRTRSEAIQRNAAVTINANSGGWNNGWVIRDSTNNTLVVGGGIPNVSVSCTGTCPTTVTYGGNGRLSGNASFSMTLSAPNASANRCLLIAPSGLPGASVC